MSLKDFFSFFSRDPAVILRNLRSDSLSSRMSASGWLKDLAPPEATLEIVEALQRKDEDIRVVVALIKALHRINTDDAHKAMDWYLSNMARQLTHETGYARDYASILLHDVRDCITSSLASFHGIRIALLHVMLDPASSPGYKLRAYRTMKVIDPLLLDLADPNKRLAFERGDAILKFVSGFAKAATKVVVRSVVTAVTSEMIDVHVTGALNPAIKSFRDALVQRVGSHSVASYNVTLNDGTEINIPEISDIPDTEFFKFFEEIIDALTHPYSVLPPSLREH